MNPIRWKPILWAIAFEAAVVVLIAACGLFGFGEHVALSALLGGLLFLLPNTYFTISAFRYQGTQWMPQVANSFNKGLMGKLFLTALGFAMVFHYNPNILPLVIFFVYGLCMAVHVVVARAISNYCGRLVVV